jgi:hypothetical protein
VYIVPLPPIVGKVDKDTPDYLHMTICEKYKILAFQTWGQILLYTEYFSYNVCYYAWISKFLG